MYCTRSSSSSPWKPCERKKNFSVRGPHSVSRSGLPPFHLYGAVSVTSSSAGCPRCPCRSRRAPGPTTGRRRSRRGGSWRSRTCLEGEQRRVKKALAAALGRQRGGAAQRDRGGQLPRARYRPRRWCRRAGWPRRASSPSGESARSARIAAHRNPRQHVLGRGRKIVGQRAALSGSAPRRSSFGKSGSATLSDPLAET